MKKLCIFVLLISSSLSVAKTVRAIEHPSLSGITCKAWNNFEDDYASAVDNFARGKGHILSQDEYQLAKTDAYIGKIDYISGLIDAYTGAYTARGDHYNFPFTFGDYMSALKKFSKDPEYADMPVAIALILVNNELKRRVQSGK